MKKIFVFLLVFIFFLPKTGGSGLPKNIGTNKKEFVYSKTVSHFSDLLGADCDFVVDTTAWHRASASFYDPHDSTQTKNDSNGIGAFGRRVSSGSIALGSSLTKILIKKGLVAFVEVRDLKHIKTPYGDGVFRVDDRMGDKFSIQNKFYVDFNQHDLTKGLRRLGRFNISFRFKFITVHESERFFLFHPKNHKKRHPSTAKHSRQPRSCLCEARPRTGKTSAVIHRLENRFVNKGEMGIVLTCLYCCDIIYTRLDF